MRLQQPADQPQINFAVDRTKASQLGLSERDVANSMLLSLSGSSQVHPTSGSIREQAFNTPLTSGCRSIQSIRLPPLTQSRSALTSPAKTMHKFLRTLQPFGRSNGSPIFSHYNVMPVIDVFCGVSGRDMGGVLREIAPLVEQAKKDLPKGSFIMLRGQADTMNSSFTGLWIGLLMATVLVYLLLVVNFQSWLDPLIIMAALPGALAGGCLGAPCERDHP